MRLFITLCLTALCLLGAGTSASAQGKVTAVVLGLRSVEGDDDIANAFTDALRDAAHDIKTWSVLERSVSMTQMSLAHGCDEIDAACLSDIAKGLSVDRVVYGTIRRTSARDQYDFQIALNMFDAGSGSIGGTATDTIPKTQAESLEGLRPRALALLQRVSGSAAGGGVVRIQTDVETAEVRIDGQPVGQVQDHLLRIEGVAPGEHTFEIAASGYAPWSKLVTVYETTPTNVEALVEAEQNSERPQAQPSNDGSAPSAAVVEQDYGDVQQNKSLDWLGYTLLGVSGASLVGVVASWLVINGINGDATYTKYSKAVDPKMNDLCSEASAGHTYGLSKTEVQDVADMCKTGSTFEVLQYVFIGTAIVSGGVGAYILATDKERTRSASAQLGPRLALAPDFGPRSASLTAKLSF